MKNLIICGINGRMGKSVFALSKEYDFSVVCGIDKNLERQEGQIDCPVYSSFKEVKFSPDVVIDFSSPQSITDILEFCKVKNCPAVICTTGYNKMQEDYILRASQKIAIFKSSNTSVGINLLTKLCNLAANGLENCDIEIIEKHHRNKTDTPSGTAISIAQEISRNSKNHKYSHQQLLGKRKEGEIYLHSIRGGNIFGEHEVLFMSDGEILTLSHVALSSDIFAIGALKAANFLLSRSPKLYTMNDLID